MLLQQSDDSARMYFQLCTLAEMENSEFSFRHTAIDAPDTTGNDGGHIECRIFVFVILSAEQTKRLLIRNALHFFARFDGTANWGLMHNAAPQSCHIPLCIAAAPS
jgi:hypothetical protein